MPKALSKIESLDAPTLSLERWQSLDSLQRQGVLALHVSDEQLEFCGSVERAVSVCESAKLDEVAGLAVLRGRHPVGFFVLSRGAKLPDWAPHGAVALTAMRIDSRHQGQGFGKVAMALLAVWVAHHWPTNAILALCVDDENVAGRRAYAAAGFVEYAEPRQGRIGIVRYLSKLLDPILAVT